MTTTVTVPGTAPCAAPGAVIERIGAGLCGAGQAVVDGWLPGGLVAELAHTCAALAAHDRLAPAGIGPADLRIEAEGYRKALIRWIEPPLTGAEALWLEHCERLRVWLNEHLLLGLIDFECHYSAYPVGGFYRRHLDRFVTDDRRMVSCVLYLNADWHDIDGGALRIHPEAGSSGSFCDILPQRGRLVVFLSDRFPHEVLPTRRERLAITGWFRRRSIGGQVLL